MRDTSLCTIESLEPRRLLSSGGVPDPNFGVAGTLVGYEAQAVLPNGQIIATKVDNGPLFLLQPDGTVIGPYAGNLPPPVPQNVQADGKTLVLNNGVLTRHNRDGSIDKSFGNNGSVSSFLTGTLQNSFTAYSVLVKGSKILVFGTGFNGDYAAYPFSAVVSLNLNGSLNQAFANNGQYVMDDVYQVYFAKIGPDNEVYVACDTDDGDPTVTRFSNSGFDGSHLIFGAGVFNMVQGVAFQADGKILIAEFDQPDELALYRTNHNFTPDTTFGNNGIVFIGPPRPNDDFNAATINVGADGQIIVGTDSSSTVALLPGTKAGAGSLSGRFYDDANGDRRLDGAEPPLPYWQAYADLNDDGIFEVGEPTAYADKFGRYTIGNLSPGAYIVREVRQDGWNRTSPAGAWPAGFYSAHVSAGVNSSGLSFGNQPAPNVKGTITGTVYNDINGSEKRDANEPALAGWQVYADLNNNGVYDSGEPIATTDTSGRYTLSVPAGGYRIREVRKSGWARTEPFGAWPAGYYDIVLGPGQKFAGLDFGNAVGNSPYATVTGFLYNDLNKNGKLDPGEKGIGGFAVALFSANYSAETTTDANGKYQFSNILPGSYTIYVDRDMFLHDGWRQTSPPSTATFPQTSLTLLPSKVTRQDFLLYDRHVGQISGFMFDDRNDNGVFESGNDQPLQNGLVFLDLNDNGRVDAGEPTSFTTDGEFYYFGLLEPGTYHIGVKLSAGWTLTSPVNRTALTIIVGPDQKVTGPDIGIHE